MSNAKTNRGQTMSAATTAQQIANDKAYADGVRCRDKGLGLKKSGKYDYDAWRRLFALGFRRLYRSIDSDEAYEEWCMGWQDEAWRS